MVGEERFPLEQLTEIVGEENGQHCPALIHLVMADSAYSCPNLDRPEAEGKADTASELYSFSLLAMCMQSCRDRISNHI